MERHAKEVRNARWLMAGAAVSPLLALAVLFISMLINGADAADAQPMPADVKQALVWPTAQNAVSPVPQKARTAAARPSVGPRELAKAQAEANALAWPTDSAVITSGYGRRVDPVDRIGAYSHKGLDIRADVGTPVLAASEGRVIFVGRNGGSGLTIKIDHGAEVITKYSHLSRTHVRTGAVVKAGETIGLSGKSGRVTGPHLHFEIWKNGEPQNPLEFRWRDVPTDALSSDQLASAVSEEIEFPQYFAGENL